MEEKNIHIICFSDLKSAVCDLYQYDKGQIMLFDEKFKNGTEVQFENKMVKAIIDSQIVIPDAVLETAGVSAAWIQVIEDDNETTIYKIILKIAPRAKKNDYVEPEDEQSFREEVQKMIEEAGKPTPEEIDPIVRDYLEKNPPAPYDDSKIKADIRALQNDKQNNISDLEEIRSGANKGATALQEVPSEYAKKSELPIVPSKVSAFQNDAGYLTEHQSLNNYYTKADADGKFALKGEGGGSYDDTEIRKEIAEINTSLSELNERVTTLLPIFTSADNGKVLGIVNGALAWVEASTPQPTPVRPTVPSGTWQLKTTTDKKYVIIGSDDDIISNTKFYRLMRTYGLPYTMNTEGELINRMMSSDEDSFFTSSDAPSLFPSGVTLAELGKHMHDNNLGEVAQHGSSNGLLWDSEKLVGTILDTLYADYTSQGGTKTKEEFRLAMIEDGANSDIRQGASYVAEQRANLENALGFYIDTVGIWGGTKAFTVDGIEIGEASTRKQLTNSNYSWREDNYWAVGTVLQNGDTAQTHSNPYKMVRHDTPSNYATYISNMKYGDCVEFYSHNWFGNASQTRSILEGIKALADNGTIEVVTRKQFAELGEYVENPITSISITRDGAIEVDTTDDLSKYTVTATYNDGTSADVSSEAIIDNSGVDTSKADTYTVTVTYRGFNASVNVTVVGGGMTYPSGLKDKDYWFIVNDTTKDVYIALNTSGVISELSNYDVNWAPSNTPIVRFGGNGKYNSWSSTDGGQTWTQEHTNTQHYANLSIASWSTLCAKGDNIAMIESSGNFELKYFN